MWVLFEDGSASLLDRPVIIAGCSKTLAWRGALFFAAAVLGFAGVDGGLLHPSCCDANPGLRQKE